MSTGEHGSFIEPGVGDVLAGRYRLERELGRGGFGVVYRATHLDTRRTVAVKILNIHHAQGDRRAVERFRREAILSASLEYPNTVDVFDYGETEQGVFFLVMEYIRGTPLSEIIDREAPLSPHRVVHVVRQILYSLMEAHAKDIVHRDIKPENIMIVPLMYDANFVKVMDFGIAKMVSGGPQITQAGQTFGTPRYMAPEQLQGDEATPSTDLYAVGLVIYELFAGQPAIMADNLATTITDVIFGPPITLAPELGAPEPFRRLVARACERDPARRFQSAEQFLTALFEWGGPPPEVLAGVSPADARPAMVQSLDNARADAPTQALGASSMVERLERAVHDRPEEPLPPPPPGAEVTDPEVVGITQAMHTSPETAAYDPEQTSVVPTHAEAERPAAETRQVDPVVRAEPHESTSPLIPRPALIKATAPMAQPPELEARAAPSTDEPARRFGLGCIAALLGLIVIVSLVATVALLWATGVIKP